jgi:hypothetical protein
MTAAETLSRAEQRATLFLHSGRVLLAIAAVAVLAGSFYAGSAHRGRKDADAIYAATHKRQMDTIRVIETQYQKDTVRVTVTKEVAAKARETFAAAATTIEQAADTSTTGTLPISLVMPEVQACKSALASDSLAYQAVAAALVTMTADRDAERSRDETDEQSRPKPPRLGFRSGVAAGAGVVAVLVHFLR